MFGINGAEVLVLLLVAIIVVGPERLPTYAEQLGRWARRLRTFASTAKERVATELGEEAADVDWASLDPRRYDPRRIVREALLEDMTASPSAASSRAATTGAPHAARGVGTVGGAAATGGVIGTSSAGRPEPGSPPAPFDDEAT